MKLIQLILIVGFIAAMMMYLRFLRSSLRDRIIAVLFFGSAMVAIAVPDLTQRIANAVGVGRGTDLTFYLLALAFIFFSVLIYSKVTRLTRTLTEVVRRVAIAEARSADPRSADPRFMNEAPSAHATELRL